MESEQQDYFVSKTFIFESENNSNSQRMEIALRTDLEQVNIGEIIDIFRQKNAIFKPLVSRIYNSQIKRYVALDSATISKTFVYSPVIMIRYKEYQPEQESDKESLIGSKFHNESKRERNRQRTVREVLQYVKQWRQIHNTFDKHKQKVNLQQSAKRVGISKKSLDDYFCQLRLAEQCGFDFEVNMEQKIGVLRSFVKKAKSRGQVGLKHDKLPKKLKIIQCIGTQDIKYKKHSQQKILVDLQVSKSQIETEKGPTIVAIAQNQSQNQFLNPLNFTLNQLDDPFVNFNKKNGSKSFDDQLEQSLF